MLKIGDIVLITGSESIPKRYLGSYGRVIFVVNNKIHVEVVARINNRGSITHTAIRSDLAKIGSVWA